MSQAPDFEYLTKERLAEERDAAEARREQADKLTAHAARDLSRAIRDLAECYRLTGSDPDGDSDAHLAKHAIQAVKGLREDLDNSDKEIELWEERCEAAESRVLELGEKLDLASSNLGKAANQFESLGFSRDAEIFAEKAEQF